MNKDNKDSKNLNTELVDELKTLINHDLGVVIKNQYKNLDDLISEVEKVCSIKIIEDNKILDK